MYNNPSVNFNNKFAKIHSRWQNLSSGEPSDSVEFIKLYQDTLPAVMDFHAIENPQMQNFVKSLTTIQSNDPNFRECVESLASIEKWNGAMPLALLSGKLVLRTLPKNMVTFESKLLAEEDSVIQARIESVMNLLHVRNGDDVPQMVLNVLETYKKLIICDTVWQNKVSCQTLESLIKSLLIVTCHRKEFDQLYSLIKLQPLHRKVQLLSNEIKSISHTPHIRECKLFICAAITQDLLHSEFSQPIERQNIENFNLFVSLFMELAVMENFSSEKIEKILLCPNDMNVIGDYYYLVANILRLHKKTHYESLIIKLISIGLSHDLTHLEQIKYTKECSKLKFSESNFIEVHRRMFKALVTLGFIIRDYNLRRLCLQAASVCEPDTEFCKAILQALPPGGTKIMLEDEVEEDKTLKHLREQLESFQSAIKSDINLSKTWDIVSMNCYENLDFLHRQKVLSEDLQPLTYPGVEKYYRKGRRDDSDEDEEQLIVKKELNFVKIIQDSREFNADISVRLRQIKNPFHTTGNPIVILPTEVRAVIIRVLQRSPDFELAKGGEVMMRLSVPSEQLFNYTDHLGRMMQEQMKRNKHHLRFSFEKSQEADWPLSLMYQEGLVIVQDLCRMSFSIFDIENVMLFAITEKKMKYMPQEFVELNKNLDVDVTKNPIQNALNYLICRQLPEYTRYQRTVNLAFTKTSMLEFYNENYTFDAVPCHYKSSKKNNGDDENILPSVESKEPKIPKPRPKPKPKEPTEIKTTQQPKSAEKLPPQQSKSAEKAKRPQAVTLTSSQEKFEASPDLIRVFLRIEQELQTMVAQRVPNSVVKFDLRQMRDLKSPNKIDFTYASTSKVLVQVQKQRNNKVEILLVKQIEVMARIHGYLVLSFDTNDTIVYDDNNEPHINTTVDPRLSGALTFDHISHIIKTIDIECTVNSTKSSIKVSFRAGSRSWDKKPRKNKPDLSEIIDNGVLPASDEMVNEISEIQVHPPFQDVLQNFQHTQPPHSSPMSVVNNSVGYQNHTHYHQPPPMPSPSQYQPQTTHSQQQFNSDTSNLMIAQPPLQYYPTTVHQYEATPPPPPPPPTENNLHIEQFRHLQSVIVPYPSEQNSVIVSPSLAMPRIKSEKVNIISVDTFTQPKFSFSDPITPMLALNGFENNHQESPGLVDMVVKMEVKEENPSECEKFEDGATVVTDFEAAVPAAQLVKPPSPSRIYSASHLVAPTPPISPTPLSHHVSAIKPQENKPKSCPEIVHDNGHRPSVDHVHQQTNAFVGGTIKSPLRQTHHQNTLESGVLVAADNIFHTPKPNFEALKTSTSPPKSDKKTSEEVLTKHERPRSKPYEEKSYTLICRSQGGGASKCSSKQQIRSRSHDGDASKSSPKQNHSYSKSHDGSSRKSPKISLKRSTSTEKMANRNTSVQSVIVKPKSTNPVDINLGGHHKHSEHSSPPADRIMNNTPPADVIDLTDEVIILDYQSPHKSSAIATDPLSFDFVDCDGASDATHMFTSSMDLEAPEIVTEVTRVASKDNVRLTTRPQRTIKRRRISSTSDDDSHDSYEKYVQPKVRSSKVLLVDVMEHMKEEERFKTAMRVNATPVDPEMGPNLRPYTRSRRDYQLTNSEHEPALGESGEPVNDISQSTFYIVYRSTVSYESAGAGIANNLLNTNNQCNEDNSCKLVANVNNNRNLLNSGFIDNFKHLRGVDLTKSFSSDKNRSNFTKNLKNSKKFCCLMPKVNNDVMNDGEKSVGKGKGEEKGELYQLSQEVLASVPGMNSLEFFELPRKSRDLLVEVIHVMKNGGVNDGEAGDGSETSSSQSNGGEASGEVQKIGQTSIQSEAIKTIQTSFGSIIKNTYPPAILTRGTCSGSKGIKIEEKKTNIRVVAGPSQVDTKRNQTLINMLTQQVMLPTNSNRHYIITNSVTKCENNITTVTSSLPNVKKVVTTQAAQQSQLVQILNSPPSSFTMKSTAPAKPPELPTPAKQQGIVQFICKTDGKIIHLTPICNNSPGGGQKKITYKVDTSGAKGPTILHHANQQIIINNQLKKSDNQNILTIIQKQDEKPKAESPISTRSIYEETYAKFIQTSSSPSQKPTDMGLLTISSSPITSCSTTSSFIQKIGKTVIQPQVLPKFNQAFGKAVFAQAADPNKMRKHGVNFAETKPVTKITRTVSEIKSTDAGTLLSLIDSEGGEKPLPTLQSGLLYARPIGNGKLLTSTSNNVLLTALRGHNQTSNVRIISSIADSRPVMTPMRISVPIQIPKLIRPQTPGNFRQQIVIATTPTRPMSQCSTQIQTQCQVQVQAQTSKLESLLKESEPDQHQQPKQQQSQQQKKVDHSTLEQLREFDMVLEQVLERSSSEVTMSSPPTPESVSRMSPKRLNRSNTVTITSISPNESPSKAKAVPKLQEDEHTAQRILDILANYKEQVRNSPDLNNKPAPRRRANPPTNPPAAKRKKVLGSGNIKNSKQFGSTSDMMTDTMGSEEDSSCGMGSGVASTGSINNSPQHHDIDDHTDVSMDNNFYGEDAKREREGDTALSPQSSGSSPSHNKFPISRRVILTESKPTVTTTAQQLGTAAVLMPGNYLLPMNVLKSGQLAILSSNNGQKIIAVPTSQIQSGGTSIILQRYLNQSNEKPQESAFKSLRLQQTPSTMSNSSPSSNTLYIRPIPSLSESKTTISMKTEDASDKTLITEIIKQQQQLSNTHQHPQQNFMIKLNEHQPSDPRSSSSIMFVSNQQEPPKIKIEELDYDEYMKEDAIDLLNESADPMSKSPMLNTKIEADDNTNSNHEGGMVYDGSGVKLENDHDQKFQIKSGECISGKGFLVDPTNKIVTYNDRKPGSIEKEFFSQKSFSEECADLGVDEPIASDLFPEADLLFDSGSPKLDQFNSNDGSMHIKKELENGQVLLEMNYNHNMETEPWLNFDTEEDLVDDDGKGNGGGHSGDYF